MQWISKDAVPMSSKFFSTSVIPANHFHNVAQAERNEKNYLLFLKLPRNQVRNTFMP